MPGIATMKPGVCTLCASGCGLTVRMMMADADVVRNGQAGLVRIHAAKKLEGSADHPVNHGGLCARGQAAIQVTYHPDRITQPLKRSGESRTGTVRGRVLGRCDRANSCRASTRWRRRATRSRWRSSRVRGIGHRAALIDRIPRRVWRTVAQSPTSCSTTACCAVPTHEFRSRAAANVRSARTRDTSSASAPTSWARGTRRRRRDMATGLMRQGRPGIRGMFVQVESRMSQTGANADQWVPVKPGTEGVLALGLAHVIMAAKLRPAECGRAGRCARSRGGHPG